MRARRRTSPRPWRETASNGAERIGSWPRKHSVRCDDGRASVGAPVSLIYLKQVQNVAPPEKLKTCVWSYLPFETGTAKSKRIGPIGEAQIRLAPTDARMRFGSQTFAQLGWVMRSTFEAGQ